MEKHLICVNMVQSRPNKDQYSFIAFDVVHFYPSVLIDLDNAALDFASNYDDNTDDVAKKYYLACQKIVPLNDIHIDRNKMHFCYFMRVLYFTIIFVPF